MKKTSFILTISIFLTIIACQKDEPFPESCPVDMSKKSIQTIIVGTFNVIFIVPIDDLVNGGFKDSTATAEVVFYKDGTIKDDKKLLYGEAKPPSKNTKLWYEIDTQSYTTPVISLYYSEKQLKVDKLDENNSKLFDFTPEIRCNDFTFFNAYNKIERWELSRKK